MVEQEACTILTLELPHVVDMRDYGGTKATIVNSGRSILLEQPTVPKWMLYNQAEVRDAIPQHQRNHWKELSYDLQAAKITNPQWCTRKTLIHLPEGERCTSDYSAECKIEDGQIVLKSFNPHVLTLEEMLRDPDASIRDWAVHHFHPVTFEVRLVTERLSLKRDIRSNVNSLSAALKGRKPIGLSPGLKPVPGKSDEILPDTMTSDY
jgi:hypothetical protein